MASLLAVSASAAKRRLPVLMSFYGRLRSSKCSFERRERESEGGKLGLARKINGAPPQDLELRLRLLWPGVDIHAPCIISETKCWLCVSEIIKSSAVSQPLPAEEDLSPKPKLQSLVRHYTSTSLNLNANANRDIVIHSVDKDACAYFTIYSVDEEDGSMSPKYYIYPPSSIKKNWIFFGATCNGLFHLVNLQWEHVLWNSVTDAIKTLPMTVVPRPLISAEQLNSGMWYDHKRQNYKLLQLVWTHKLDEEGELTGEDGLCCIWLYSLKRNSWKEIPCTEVWSATPSRACINGVYYCAAFLHVPDSAPVILSFDFSAETRSIVPLPFADQDLCYCILEYKGLLSILAYSVQEHAPTKYELWVRKGKDWTRESVFHVCGVWNPLWFSKNGHLLYFESVNQEIVVFDRALGKSKNLGIHCHSTQPEIYPFVESSVQLDGYDEELDEEEGEEDDTKGGALMT